MTTKLKIRTPNGRFVTIEPLIYGAAVKVTNRKISTSLRDDSTIDFTEAEFDDGFCDEVFAYTSWDEAWAAVLDWNGVGDPQGWIRHQPSDRRRPGGDASKEYIAP